MIAHHPSQPTLLSYASGHLAEALALVVATHLGACASCRQSVAVLEMAGGALLNGLAPASLTGDMLDRLLLRLDEAPAPPPPILHPDLPAPLNRLVLGRWWPVTARLRFRPITTGGSAWAGLLLGKPGTVLPRHGHAGVELTCVLAGAFRDALGEYRPGDLSEPTGDHDQPPAVIGTKPCLCVIASEGMRLRGSLGLLQRLLGQ